ncbi:MAG: DUF4446 family protein [Candidatus Nealsonbacteria bacterium]|nr:DUF4446 family protein [Candidatus Nealsonbacteria bacterium]
MFDLFKKKKKPENLEQVVGQLEGLEQKIQKISREVESLTKKQELAVQKVEIIRYNPFQESGGDQSFSLALLDKNNNGVVVTSLYGRDANRIFAKPVKEGRSTYSLSKEENKVLERAKSRKVIKKNEGK